MTASGRAGGGDGEGRSESALERIRERILEVDRTLVELVGERRALVLEVGRIKGSLGLPVLDPQREARVVRRAAQLARDRGVDEEMVRDVIWRIIASARDAQEDRSSWGPPPHREPNDLASPDDGGEAST